MNRRKFIQSIGTLFAALLASAIDKRGTPVVQCNQDDPWRIGGIAYPINAHDGQIRTICDFKTGQAMQIVFDGKSAYHEIVSVATDFIGEINIGLAPLGSWMPLIRV